jgi:hypothetical protein
LSIPTFDTPKNWLVVYPDGRYVSNEERDWSELSVERVYGRETLYVLKDEASSLAACVAGRWHALRAPAGEEVHFFRYHRARTSLTSNTTEQLYHAIGYVFRGGKLTLEIDTRSNTTLRFDPVLD